MDVIDHEPGMWFLFSEGDALLLDARVDHSAFTASLLIELDAAERRAYESGGHAAMTELATAIHMSAPLARDTRSPYAPRDLSRVRSDEIMAAVRRWRAATDLT